jgi:membrane fusion protein, multidrug efflux system
MIDKIVARKRVLPIALAGVAVALALVAYGIWSRSVASANLQTMADDTALTRVRETNPKQDTSDQSLTLPGEIAAWNQAAIFGQVSGYVSGWYKDYGAHVNAGDVLATINAPSLDAEYEASKANLAVAQARYNLAELTAKRFKALNSDAVSQQDVDDKVAASAQQKAELVAAQQSVQQFEAMIGFKKIVSPFAGIVTARRVNIGDFINTSGGDATRSSAQPLFNVADIHKLRVLVSVPQAYGAFLKPDIKSTLSVYGNPARTFEAKFLATAGAVDRATRSIVTEFVLDEPPPELQPGAFVTVKLEGKSASDILTIPAQALLFRAQGPQVALIAEGDKVHLQSVTVGRNLGLSVQVLTGLKPTDRIVANPSLGLLEGQLVKVVEPVPGYEPASSATDGNPPRKS